MTRSTHGGPGQQRVWQKNRENHRRDHGAGHVPARLADNDVVVQNLLGEAEWFSTRRSRRRDQTSSVSIL